MEEVLVLRIYIVAGVTSSLFASLLPTIRGVYDVYATVRNESDPDRVAALRAAGIKFISTKEALGMSFARILWLSTHDDVGLLVQFSSTPTVAINSGAIMDILMGKQDESTANAYQRSKMALYRVPGVYSFICGFFIEDLPVPSWASRGLHGDTTAKLFARDADPRFDWNKAYSVTPKSYIVKALALWLEHPTEFQRAVIVCSDRQYRRHELRAMAKLPSQIDGQAPPLMEPVYATFPHLPYGLELTQESIEKACVEAAGSIEAKR